MTSPGRLRVVSLAICTVTAALSLGAPAGAVRVTQHPLPPKSTPASTIFADTEGLFVTNNNHSVYSTIQPSPTFTVVPGPEGSGVYKFFVGPDGRTWYINGLWKQVSGVPVQYPQIGEVGPGNTAELLYQSATSWGNPFGPLNGVTGPDAGAWISSTSYSLDRLAPGDAVPGEVHVPGCPDEIVSLDGSLWATETCNSALVQVAPPAGVTVHSLVDPRVANSGTSPEGLVVGPEGDLYVAETDSEAIARFVPGTDELTTFRIPRQPDEAESESPQPSKLTVGPEGAIWFTDLNGFVGRLANGNISEYPLSSNEHIVPTAITTFGSELWVTEEEKTELASINPSAPAEETAPPSGAKATPTTVSRSALSRELRPPNAGPRLLVRDGGYHAHVPLPAGSHITITWKGIGTRTTLARGTATATTAATSDVRVLLTPAGRRVLRKARGVRVLATAAVVVADSTVTGSRTFTLAR